MQVPLALRWMLLLSTYHYVDTVNFANSCNGSAARHVAVFETETWKLIRPLKFCVGLLQCGKLVVFREKG